MHMNGFVVGILILVAVGGGLYILRSKVVPTAIAEKRSAFPPKPKWKPTIPVNVDLIEKTLSYYSDNKKSFVIFKYGTAVLFDAHSATPEEDAKKRLKEIFLAHPDFHPQLMDDGNYSVGYSQPAYSVVFKEEFETYKDYIDANHLDGLCVDEVLLDGQGRPNQFDERGKIGLLARARMFLDAQAPVIAIVHRGDRG